MSVLKLLAHLFIPHESNNQKAKILHPISLTFLAVFIVGFQVLLSLGGISFPKTLGYAANISPAEVIRLTNVQRAASGLSAVTENGTLDAAALAKGNDMLAKGYWAHFAPDGTSPWSFFLKFGYKYQYAGENLARDFSDAPSAVNAWMNSPTHKENILNPHYKEVGIGVVEGSLAGANTTIIVQFFGTALGGSPSIPIAKAKDVGTPKPVLKVVVSSPVPKPSPPQVTPSPSATPQKEAISTVSKQLFSPFSYTKNLSLGIVGLLLLVLSIDLIVVRHKRIARIGGRTLAHIAYLGMVLAVILILKAGQII
ncbi:MAG TPA: CAP domain-containing protein [Patescibacteria group bacterium]|nr:CAP domain-containing protein [Patescibacteria group bacterium]